MGYMSLFSKAVSIALQHFPMVNSQINEDEIITFDYVDISIAVSTPKGLVVPVLRNVEQMKISQIEISIKEFAAKARRINYRWMKCKGELSPSPTGAFLAP